MYAPGSKNQHVDSAFAVWKLTQLRNVFLVTSTLHSLVSLLKYLQSTVVFFMERKGDLPCQQIFLGERSNYP